MIETLFCVLPLPAIFERISVFRLDLCGVFSSEKSKNIHLVIILKIWSEKEGMQHFVVTKATWVIHHKYIIN